MIQQPIPAQIGARHFNGCGNSLKDSLMPEIYKVKDMGVL
jgi:hypothetical protein